MESFDSASFVVDLKWEHVRRIRRPYLPPIQGMTLKMDLTLLFHWHIYFDRDNQDPKEVIAALEWLRLTHESETFVR
jgi:hypothetical protein